MSDTEKKFHFSWSSGESVSYTRWAPGEPNNVGNGEDFVAIYYPNHDQGNKWNDWNDRTRDPIGLPMNGVQRVDRGRFSHRAHSLGDLRGKLPQRLFVAAVVHAEAGRIGALVRASGAAKQLAVAHDGLARRHAALASGASAFHQDVFIRHDRPTPEMPNPLKATDACASNPTTTPVVIP